MTTNTEKSPPVENEGSTYLDSYNIKLVVDTIKASETKNQKEETDINLKKEILALESDPQNLISSNNDDVDVQKEIKGNSLSNLDSSHISQIVRVYV